MMKNPPSRPACRGFRDRFRPGLRDPHRDACDECARFADLLEGSISAEAHRPLPGALRHRLLAIPRREMTCREHDRLYRAALERSGHRPADATERGAGEAAERHLASCARCRELCETLESAFAAEPVPAPNKLLRRLSALARHPEQLLPWWIRDGRYAAAACYLVAALALTLAEDASAVLRSTTAAVSTRAQQLTTAGEDRSVEAWYSFSESLNRGWGESRLRAERYAATGERWLEGAKTAIESKARELIPDRERSVEGD